MHLAIFAMRLLEVVFFVGLAGSSVVVLISFVEDGIELFGKDEPPQPRACQPVCLSPVWPRGEFAIATAIPKLASRLKAIYPAEIAAANLPGFTMQTERRRLLRVCADGVLNPAIADSILLKAQHSPEY